MTVVVINKKAREASIHAVVTRADGTTEDLGMIAYWHRNPIKRWWGNMKIKIAERNRKK